MTGGSATDSTWQPSADLAQLRLRAGMLAAVRAFFFERQVLEVDTPVLSHAGTVDPHIESFSTVYEGPGGQQPLFLQTSPEFAMKRLLAAGSGSIYQICKAFRNGEAGRMHNPEFTLLEWYRTGFDYQQLMDEIDELLQHLGLLQTGAIPRLSYCQLFVDTVGLDPLTASHEALISCIQEHKLNVSGLEPGSMEHTSFDRDDLLNLILTHLIEPELRQYPLVYIVDYPASQASLAYINPDRPDVAERFELYADGVELANGFTELTDKDEQLARFQRESRQREQHKLAQVPFDQRLIAALKEGLDACAGVAIGLDRLLMVMAKKHSIQELIAFPFDRA